MKKVINGKMYNTETAQEVGMFWNGLSGSDFRNCTERLFKKKTGEFFLYGIGGPMSPYCESFGGCTSGSKEIIPMSVVEAKIWVEKKLSGEKYIEIFGEVEE